ncbi:MAG TPA: hypothetical protein VIF14_18600 [Alphaproteobacteria bacterium]|jgi:hypothetical protein
MKTTVFALAAAIGLAIAAPSFAATSSGDQTNETLAKKVKVVKHKKVKLAKFQCRKPVLLRGVKRCPAKGVSPAVPK